MVYDKINIKHESVPLLFSPFLHNPSLPSSTYKMIVTEDEVFNVLSSSFRRVHKALKM
jgi:hypothetical protein